MISANINQVLKDQGYSVTSPRLLVFELLQNHEPQSIQQLLQRAAGAIDRASLYRTLNLFVSIGVASRISIGWKYRYELAEQFSHHHHHLSCSQCGAVISIQDDTAVTTFIERVAADHDFIPTEHQFEITGLCKRCAKK